MISTIVFSSYFLSASAAIAQSFNPALSSSDATVLAGASAAGTVKVNNLACPQIINFLILAARNANLFS